MKYLPLSQGLSAIVDDEDYEELNKFKWYAKKHRNTFYVYRNSMKIEGYPKRKTGIKLHRVIMSAPKELQVDHKNGNGLDNRKENLRLCTNIQNHQNRKATERTSKYKGVHWHKATNKWQVQIRVACKRKHLGVFEDEILAAKEYDKEASAHFGEFARLNFN